jgi:hypothetical protein
VYRRLALILSVGGIACGGDDTSQTIDGAIDSPGSGGADAAIDSPAGSAFTLTSPTITNGGTIPLTHV